MKKGFLVRAIAGCLAIAITFGSVTPSFAAEATVSEGIEQLTAPNLEYNYSDSSVSLENTGTVTTKIVAGLVPTNTSGTPTSDEYIGVSVEVAAGGSETLTLSDLNTELLQGTELSAGEYRLFAYAEETGDYLRSEVTVKKLPRIVVEEKEITDAVTVVFEENSEYLYFDGLTTGTYKGVLVRYELLQGDTTVEKWCLAEEVDGKVVMEAALIAEAESWSVKGVECFNYNCGPIKSTFTWVSYTNIVNPGKEEPVEPEEPVAELTMEMGNDAWIVTNNTEEEIEIYYGFATEAQLANGVVADPYGTTLKANEVRNFYTASFALHYPTMPGTYYFAIYTVAEDGSNEIIAATDYPIAVSRNSDISSITVNKDDSGRVYLEGIYSSAYDVCRVDFWINDGYDAFAWYDFLNCDEEYYCMAENSQAYLDALVEWNIESVSLSSMTYSNDGVGVNVTVVDDIQYAFNDTHECTVAEETITPAAFDKDGEYIGTCSCGEVVTRETIYAISAIFMDQTSYTYSGMFYEPTIVIRDSQNKALELNTDYTVEYIDNCNAGTATAKIVFKNKYTGTKEQDFTILPYTLGDAFTIQEIAAHKYTGEEIKPEVAVAQNSFYLQEGVDYTVSYSNNVEIGTATVTVTGKGNYCGTLTSNFEITARTITSDMIAAIADCEYTGDLIKPEITVTDGTKILAKGQDYSVSYRNNLNAGTATVNVYGIGKYSGSTSVTFKITAVDLYNTATISIAEKEYTGEAVELIADEIKLSWNNKGLVPGRDYKINEHFNNIDATSDARVSLEGIGNFTGTKILFFHINPVVLSDDMVAAIPAQEYNGTAVTPDVKITVGSKVLVKGTDYTVSYEDHAAVGTATAIVQGIKNYSGTVAKKFLIGKRALDAAMIQPIASQTYTGKEMAPEICVIADGIALVKDTDYTVEYSDNVVVGNAAVKVTGIGSYTGTAEAAFEIVPAVLEADMVADIEAQKYNTTALMPKVTVTNGGVTLTEGTDYTVVYENNIAVGTAKVTITGINNYSGNVTKEFVISESVLDASMIQKIASQTYTGTELTPVVIVVTDGVTLTKDVDYTVEYADNIEAGTAKAVVTGIGFYAGTAEKTFKINAKALSPTVSVQNEIGSQKYTGEEMTPAVVLYDSALAYELVEGEDYTVTYSNNLNVGQGAVLIKGIGNYKSSIKVLFDITRKSIADCELSVTDKVYYTGKSLTPTVTVKDGTKKLVKGTDYTVSYTSNINLGKATVIVKGIGNYKSTVYDSFIIAPKAVTLDSVIASTSYAGRILVEWNKYSAADGYVVQYATNKSFEDAKEQWINDETDTDATLKKLEEGKGYYVRVAAYKKISGTNIIGKYSSYEYAKTKISFDVSLKDTVDYTGKSLNGSLKVTANGKTLKKGTDYTTVYSNNKNPGKATVTVKGIGTYAGTVKDSFIIVPKQMSLTSVKASVDDPGRMIVKWKKDSLATGYILKYSTDSGFSKAKQKTFTKNTYVESNFSNGLEKGVKYYVKIAAYTTVDGVKYIGDYSAVKSVTLKKSFAVESVGNVTYTGKERKPSVVVTSDGVTLTQDKDYTLICSDNVKPGKAKVTIVGIGAYAGTVTRTFIIVPKQAGGLLVKNLLKGFYADWTKDSNATGYKLQYSKNKSFTSGVTTVTITNNSTSDKTIRGLSKGTTYYVRVASYKTIDGTRYYGSYSTVKSVTTR